MHQEDRSTRATSRARRGRHTGAGQALIEFSMVAVVLIFSLLSGLNVIQIVMANYTVTQAARAAANEAALSGGDQTSATSAAALVLGSGITTSADPAKATVSMRCAQNPCRRYDRIDVTVTYQDQVWAPIFWWKGYRAHAATTRTAEIDAQ